MSVLSITAPQFTVEDERLEQETLTLEEYQAAERDLFGNLPIPPSHSSFSSLPPLEDDEDMNNNDNDKDNNNNNNDNNKDPLPGEEELEGYLQALQDAMEELPAEDKEAYLQAMEKVPELVELESNPVTFLKAEEYRPWPAAERLVNYWELRKWLFRARAWLPMTSTGNGCLNEDDIELLKTGFCSLLKDSDEEGRGILCFRVPTHKLNYDRMAMVRVVFYMLTVALAERESVATNGLVVVADTKHFTTSRFDRKFMKCVSYLFTGYHPITTRAYHVCTSPGVKSCFMLVLPFIRYFMTRHVRQRFLVHTGTHKECCMDLNDYGIPPTALPTTMGGSFDLEHYFLNEWLPIRHLFELQQEKEESMANLLERWKKEYEVEVQKFMDSSHHHHHSNHRVEIDPRPPTIHIEIPTNHSHPFNSYRTDAESVLGPSFHFSSMRTDGGESSTMHEHSFRLDVSENHPTQDSNAAMNSSSGTATQAGISSSSQSSTVEGGTAAAGRSKDADTTGHPESK